MIIFVWNENKAPTYGPANDGSGERQINCNSCLDGLSAYQAR
ncbi:hypothetical protein PS634_04764 [Pseudomonas fluorescens]|nr:hypothetical protein PS634_04764 [Pseudomonas fluorescens]